MKWRFFRHLLSGSDPDSERVYRWHIEERSGARMRMKQPTDRWKMTVDDYVKSAESLFKSMQKFGFVPAEAIPIDVCGELLGGAHRVACAIALGEQFIPVERRNTLVWAPRWHREWFVEHGMDAKDLRRLDSDLELMRW